LKERRYCKATINPIPEASPAPNAIQHIRKRTGFDSVRMMLSIRYSPRKRWSEIVGLSRNGLLRVLPGLGHVDAHWRMPVPAILIEGVET